MRELTKEEQNAINSLKRLAKRWPKSLMLFSGSGELCVLDVNKCQDWPEGTPEYKAGGFNPDSILDRIQGIPNDGGDW